MRSRFYLHKTFGDNETCFYYRDGSCLVISNMYSRGDQTKTVFEDEWDKRGIKTQREYAIRNPSGFFMPQAKQR